MIRIRPADANDVPWLVGQLRIFSRFVGTKKPLFSDDEYARIGMTNMVKDHLVLMADDDAHGQVGFIAGLVTPHMMNPTIRTLVEVFWWVAEDHRHTRAGAALLNDFIAWGKAHVDWITFGVEAKSPVRESTLLKRGFRLQERNYLMEVV